MSLGLDLCLFFVRRYFFSLLFLARLIKKGIAATSSGYFLFHAFESLDAEAFRWCDCASLQPLLVDRLTHNVRCIRHPWRLHHIHTESRRLLNKS